MGFESVEFDSGYVATSVAVMWADIGIVGVVVPKDFVALLRRVVLESVVVPAGFGVVLDGEQLDARSLPGVDLEVPVEDDI